MPSFSSVGRNVRRLGSDVRGAADGWFSWSQRNKYATILILVTVMIAITMYFQLQDPEPSSARYSNMNIQYGQDGFPTTDNEAIFVPPQVAADKSSMAGSKGTQGGTVW